MTEINEESKDESGKITETLHLDARIDKKVSTADIVTKDAAGRIIESTKLDIYPSPRDY